MNKKATKKSNSGTAAGKLAFRRETIRSLRADEAARVVGGRNCLPESCRQPTCPESVCTITLDQTI